MVGQRSGAGRSREREAPSEASGGCPFSPFPRAHSLRCAAPIPERPPWTGCLQRWRPSGVAFQGRQTSLLLVRRPEKRKHAAGAAARTLSSFLSSHLPLRPRRGHHRQVSPGRGQRRRRGTRHAQGRAQEGLHQEKRKGKRGAGKSNNVWTFFVFQPPPLSPSTSPIIFTAPARSPPPPGTAPPPRPCT